MANVGAAKSWGTEANEPSSEYTGSRFSDVRAQLLSDPYPSLPEHRVTLGSMFKGGMNLLTRDSSWLINKEADMAPPHPKLLNSLGVCFFGKWKVTEDTGYTGCLRGGSEHLLVVRCSNLLTNTRRGTRRGFGFGGKIFPTLDPDEAVKTANFICIDNLGETFAQRYTDVALTNEPPTTYNFGQLRIALVLANCVWVFRRADTLPSHRPIYQLYERGGLLPGETPKGPKWIQITAEEGTVKNDLVDFRDELRLKNYPDGKLRFTVSVASETSPAGARQWRRIGFVELTEDVCSASGDQRIRFRHVPNKGHAPA